MPPKQVRIMDPICSDHSPLSLDIEEHQDNYKRPFKFFNCLVQHQEFKDSKERVDHTWEGYIWGLEESEKS